MSEDTIRARLNQKIQIASYKVLQLMTLRKQGQYLQYASAALAIASMGQADLPTALAATGATIGVEALGDLLGKLANGEDLSEDVIIAAVERAIAESDLQTLMQSNEGLAEQITQLTSWQKQIETVLERDQEMAAELIAQYKTLSADVSSIRQHMEKLASREILNPRIPKLELAFDNKSKQLLVEKKLQLKNSDYKQDIKPEFAQRIVRLDLQMINSGNSPANDINIVLKLSEDVNLYNEDELFYSWKYYGLDYLEIIKLKKQESTAPLEDKWWLGLSDGLGFSIFQSEIANDRKSSSTINNNKIKSSIKDQNVKFHIPKLQHDLVQILPSLYVVFQTWDDLSTFDVDYQINADEIEAALKGKLHVIVKKTN